MKIKSLLFLACFSILGSLQAQESAAKDSFEIGIVFPPKTIVRKAQLDGEDRSISIIKITDKNKSFRGTIQNYALFTLRVDYLDSATKKIKTTSVPLFIVPGFTEIAFQVNNPIININGVSARPRFEYAMLMQDDQDYMDKIEALQSQLNTDISAGNKEKIKETKEKLKAAENRRKDKLYAAFVRRNPKNVVSLYAMNIYSMINDDNPEEVESLLNSMPASQQNTPQMLRIRARIEKNKTTMVGAMAPEFTQADTSGKEIALKDFQGKYVLVDFWASWCHPCRDQNPSLVKLYEKFKDKNFTILGVSLDSKKESWVTAIRHDKLTWYHVSDLNFWNNEVAKLYGIQSVPQNFLLDPKGKIIAKNLHDDDLEAALDDAIKNNSVN